MASNVDYCVVPVASPPSGQTSNLVNPPDLSVVTLVVGSVTTAVSLLFITGRLFLNWKKMALADCPSPLCPLIAATLTVISTEVNILAQIWLY